MSGVSWTVFMIAIPSVLLVTAVIIGARQVRSLRDLTGDHSFITSLFGLTFRAPRRPNPIVLDEHPRFSILDLFRPWRSVAASAKPRRARRNKAR